MAVDTFFLLTFLLLLQGGRVCSFNGSLTGASYRTAKVSISSTGTPTILAKMTTSSLSTSNKTVPTATPGELFLTYASHASGTVSSEHDEKVSDHSDTVTGHSETVSSVHDENVNEHNDDVTGHSETVIRGHNANVSSVHDENVNEHYDNFTGNSETVIRGHNDNVSSVHDEKLDDHGDDVTEREAITHSPTNGSVPQLSSDITSVTQETETMSSSVSGRTKDNNMKTSSPTLLLAPASSSPQTAPVSKNEACDEMLCEVTEGRYVVNSSACSENGGFTLNASDVSSLEIWSDPFDADADGKRECRWAVTVPLHRKLQITGIQLAHDFQGDFSLNLTEEENENGRNRARYSVNWTREDFQTPNAGFESALPLFSQPTLSIKHSFKGDVQRTTHVLTLVYKVLKGPSISELPNTRLSDSHGYVTSPGFDQGQPYPDSYDGVFELNVGQNESVVISIERLFIEIGGICTFDYLNLVNIVKLCGTSKKSFISVFPSTLRVHFHTDRSINDTGFKMMFVVVPRSEEPQILDDGRVNCSVPHYRGFEPLLACNMQTECLGGEDERDCFNHSRTCGRPNAMDTGTTCFTVSPSPQNHTWYSAKENCTNLGGNLPTFRSLEEYIEFRSVMSKMRIDDFVYIGAQVLERRGSVSVTHMYNRVWQWTDGTTAFSFMSSQVSARPACARYLFGHIVDVRVVQCNSADNIVLVCQFEQTDTSPHPGTTVDRDGNAGPRKRNAVLPPLAPLSVTLSNITWNVSVTECPSGHVTRDFLSCDAQAKCHKGDDDTSCTAGGVTVPMFACTGSGMALPYTLVCDHMTHCPDNSDEDFCEHPACPTGSDKCQNGQCFPEDQRCDVDLNCYDGEDEESCWKEGYFDAIYRVFPPRVIVMEGAKLLPREVNGPFVCPSSHFQCPGGFCLPVYFRCNGIDDCPGREDEAGCESYTCPGFYRCHGSNVCVHADDVCDGAPQCPRQDDELLCDLTCPEGCRCLGLAFVCNTQPTAGSYPSVRYLDADGSGMALADVNGSQYLVQLRLSRCGISGVPHDLTLPNIRQLDLGWNQLSHFDMHRFTLLGNLRLLTLIGNPLTSLTDSGSPGSRPMKLQHIYLSHTRLESYDGSVFNHSPDLRTLNVSWSTLTSIPVEGFQTTPHLRYVDLRGCDLVRYPKDLLTQLVYLNTVKADDYKLCCQAMLPAGFERKNCHAPRDLLASCEDLLRSNAYRVFLWTLASLSLAGNAGSLGARLYLHRNGDTLGSFGVFVISLTVADFFMGVYLAIVGVADRIYQGRYLWYDDEWKKSVACKTAGFLSLLSSEVSALMICLITLDRFLVLSFPFSRLQFGRLSALVACGLVWTTGIVLAAVPLLPMTSHWEFYSQTGICIPLPFTSSERFKGYDYSFSIMILLNLVLFFLIAIGQAAIYWSIRARSIPSSIKTGTRDAAIARRLTTVVVSDFLCWFPVGLLGLLAATGTPIPGELNVAVAIFVLPFNSALNPFLYTFNVLQEKRRRAQEAALMKRLESCVQMELTEGGTAREPGDRAAAIQQVKMMLRKWELSPKDVYP